MTSPLATEITGRTDFDWLVADLEDGGYPYTWLPSEDHEREASELAERGPEAFPD